MFFEPFKELFRTVQYLKVFYPKIIFSNHSTVLDTKHLKYKQYILVTYTFITNSENLQKKRKTKIEKYHK